MQCPHTEHCLIFTYGSNGSFAAADVGRSCIKSYVNLTFNNIHILIFLTDVIEGCPGKVD